MLSRRCLSLLSVLLVASPAHAGFTLLETDPFILNPGAAGFAVIDLDADGRDEIVFATQALGSSLIVWGTTAARPEYHFRQVLPLGAPPKLVDAIAQPALDGVGVLSNDGLLEIYEGFPLQRTLAVQGDAGAQGFLVADVNADVAPEAVITSFSGTRAYDLATGIQRWSSTVLGGSLVATQADADPALEILMTKSNVDGSFFQRVLDGSVGAVDWEVAGGELFAPVAVGRVGPAHARQFVAGYGFSIVTVTAQPWQLGWNTPVPQLRSLTVGDVDGDGQDEVIHSDRFSKNIRVLDTTTQTQRSAFLHTDAEAASLELGQFDGDAARELVYSSFGGNTRDYTAKVVDVATGAAKAGLPILRGDSEHHFAVGDVDADGQLEIVLASSNSSADGETEIRDAATNALEWRSPVPADFADPFAGTPNTVLLAQLDADPALEIVLAGTRYRGFVRVLDGATHALERLIRSDTTAPELEGEAIAEAVLCQCDPDGQLDVAVMAASTGGIGGGHRVRVYSLVDGTQAWASPLITQGTALANGIVIAQTDDDPAPELIGYDAWRIVAFDAYTHQEEWAIEGGAQRLAWAPGANGGTLFRAIGTSLQRLRGNDRALLGVDDYPQGFAGLHVPNATELLVASGDRLYRVAQSGGAPLDVSPSLGGFAGDRSGIATWLDAGALRIAVGSYRGRHVLALAPAQQILFSDGFD